MSATPEPIILPHGGYRELLTYRKSDLIYRGTLCFVDRFLEHGDRTIDQMVQAARSGKQNIVEGSQASGTSKETEIKLTNVAKASLEELLEDYLDFLKAHGAEVWPKDSEKAMAARDLGRRTTEYADWEPYFTSRPADVVANLLVSLIRQCTYLLARQLEYLDNDFTSHGGIRERMHAARTAARGAAWETAVADWFGFAESPEDLRARTAQAHDAIQRIAARIAKKKGW